MDYNLQIYYNNEKNFILAEIILFLSLYKSAILGIL